MSREFSSKLKSMDLIAYMDGEASLEVSDAVKSSPDAERQIDEWQNLETYLDENLYLSSAPSSQELGEYCLGLTSPDRTRVIKQFLIDFPQYHYELNQLKAYLKSTEPTVAQERVSTPKPSILESFKTVMAQLADAPSEMPSISLRTNPDMVVYTADTVVYTADNMHISLEIEDDSVSPNAKRIHGLLLGSDEDDLTAYLWKVDPPEEVKSSKIEHGNFELSDIEHGDYRLVINSSNMDIVIGTLRVGS